MSFRPKGRKKDAVARSGAVLIPLWAAFVAAILAASATLFAAHMAARSQIAVAAFSASEDTRKTERTTNDSARKLTLELLGKAVAYWAIRSTALTDDIESAVQIPDPMDVFVDHTLLFAPTHYLDAIELNAERWELEAKAIECSTLKTYREIATLQKKGRQTIAALDDKHRSCFDEVDVLRERLVDRQNRIREKIWESLGGAQRML